MNIQYKQRRKKSYRHLSKIKIERYFYPKKIISKGLVIATLLSTFFVLVSFALFRLFGLTSLTLTLLFIDFILLLLGMWTIRTLITLNPSDEDYDEWLAYQASLVIAEAYDVLDLYERQLINEILSIHSIILPGSRLAHNYRDEILLKQGEDGKWRSSVNLYTYFFPVDGYMAIYTRSINALNPTVLYDDSTAEYFYEDLIGVSFHAFRDTAIVDDQEFWYRVEQLSFKLFSGDDIGLGGYISARPMNPRSDAPSISLHNNRSEQTLAVLRYLLRPRKPRNRR